jgi:hypothetical protein
VLKQKHTFQHRLIGKVSYLGDKEGLMPKMIKTESGNIIHEVLCTMGSLQAASYKGLTHGKSEKDSKYLIFSRAACNFTFDVNDGRPFPEMGSTLEEGMAEKKFDDEIDGNEIDEDEVSTVKTDKYLIAVDTFLKSFNKMDTLTKYFHNNLPKYVNTEFPPPEDPTHGLQAFSMKYYNILQNIITQEGCQLFYSNFRKIEGVGMMRLLLKYQGFSELKIVKNSNDFVVSIERNYSPTSYVDPITKKKTRKIFALYTGTEDSESKELIRKIFNSQFNDIPPEVTKQLHELYGVDELNNTQGQMVNVLMITASGAEGIDLKNTRTVHIAEPYWHNVRIDQVIGRARRICSHAALKLQEQNVKVFLYMSKYKTSDNHTPLTIDQKLYGKMLHKKKLADSFLNAIKESAIDCKHNCVKLPSAHMDPTIKRTLDDIPKVGTH